MQKILFQGFSQYKKSYFKKDLIAAAIVASIAVPESLAFAAIVGVPLQAGLYTAIFAPLAYAVFGSSRRLVIGADSATAALVASAAGLIAASGSEHSAAAVALVTVMVGVALIVMSVAKLGFLANLVSRPVLIGLLAGIGVQLMIGKLPEMLGISAHGTLLHTLGEFAQKLPTMNGMTVTISILVIGLIVAFHRTRVPGELVALIAAIGFAIGFRVEQFHVELVGNLPSGLPSFIMPTISGPAILALIPAAMTIALVILAQSSAVIRSTAAEHDERVNVDRDLIGLGVANIVSGFFRGFVANGSPPRTMAADFAGAKTQATGVLAAAMILVVVLFGGKLFEYVPTAALASIVFAVGARLFRYDDLKYLWHTHRTEFFVAAIALVGVALLGVRQGILLAIVVALMERLRRQYRPRDQILLRDGELSAWAEERIGVHPHHNTKPDGVLVYSFDGSLFFENADYFAARVKAAISGASLPVRHLVIDGGVIDSIDYTAVETLKQLHRYLGSEGITLSFAHVSPHLHAQFRDFGIISLVSEAHIYPTLKAAILAQPEAKRSSAEMIKSLALPADSFVAIGGAVMEALSLRDTRDVDLVVRDDTYRKFRDEEKWQEYTQDNGKKILSYHGYNLMRSWMGYNYRRLKNNSFKKSGIDYMSVEDLIVAKTHLARKKDLADVKLLKNYRKEHLISQR